VRGKKNNDTMAPSCNFFRGIRILRGRKKIIS
jgi:hypothetical protein